MEKNDVSAGEILHSAGLAERLVEEASAKGANAVLAFRFDTSELGSTWTEICAYGTGVRVRKL